jgi:outer membrane protein
MKKFLLFAMMLFAFQLSSAQTFAKGDTFVEGTVKFVTSDDVKTFNLNPTVGYFLTDKFAAGVTVNTQSTKTAGVQTSDSFGIGVFGRCYFLNIGEHFTTFSQLAITSNSDKAADTKTLNANIGLGANYFITKNLSLVLSVADLVSYASVKAGNASAVNTTTVGFSGVTNPFATPTFGLNYRF